MRFLCRGLRSPGLLCVSASFSLLACADDDEDVEVFVTFEDSAVIEELQLAIIENCGESYADIRQQQCYAAATLRDDFEQIVRFENISEGTYGVFGRGINGTGCVTVVGCTEFLVPSGEYPRFELRLHRIEGRGCDPPDICGGPPR